MIYKIRKKNVFMSFFLILSIFLITSSLSAQKMCIPKAMGVAGTSTWDKPPNWWNSAPGWPAYNTNLDDPQWRGCLKQNFPIGGTGTLDHVSFRALHRNEGGVEYMYLSWHAKVVPAANVGYNKLLVAFSDPTNTGHDVFITIAPSIIANATANNNYLTTLWTKPSNGSTWSEYPGPPSDYNWLINSTRIWVTASTNVWAVQMRIKTTQTSTNLANGINIGNDFLMWYEVRVADPTPTAGYTPYTWPNGVQADAILDVPPAVSNWGQFRMITGAPGPACSTAGVSLRPEDIGSMNANRKEINLNGTNIFFAKPENKSSNSVSGIKARFRVANWGVQSIWEAGIPVNELWDDIADSNGVPSSGIIIPAGQKGIINTSWILSLCEKCAFEEYYNNHISQCSGCPTPTVRKRKHQCLLVTLTGGPGVTFLNDSVYENMDFVDASKFQRKAEVNIKGLPANPLGGTKRDIYLYVQALNMPELAESKSRQIISRDNIEEESTIGIRHDISRVSQPKGRTYEDLAKVKPTYIVHAYYDTGRRKSINGVEHPILSPMTSFGYFVNHEGALEGWKHHLQGESLIKIAPNFYKIVIPNNKVGEISTTIEAFEPKFAVSLRGGLGIPQGTFSNTHEYGFGFTGSLEYLINPTFSAVAVVGYHQFEGKAPNPDQKALQISLNGRIYYPLTARLKGFVNGGFGVYMLDPGDTEYGYNIGAGWDYYVTTQFALEAAYNYHKVMDTDIQFSSAQIGIHFRF